MQRLRMLTKGPNHNYRVGEIVEVDEARATILLGLKAATTNLDAKEVKSGAVRSQGR